MPYKMPALAAIFLTIALSITSCTHAVNNSRDTQTKYLGRHGKCPALQIVGVRGSRGGALDTSDTDRVLNVIKAGIASKVAGTKFRAIKYSAVPVGYGLERYGLEYLGSVGRGETALQVFLRSFFARCRHTYVVLAGFSQGADVAGNVFESLARKMQKRILLILVGDPKFNPRQSSVDRGDYSPKLSGILNALRFKRLIPKRLTPNVRSYCTKGDPVCNYSIRNLSSCTLTRGEGTCAHLEYVHRGWTRKAIKWVVARRRQLPRLA